MNKSESKYFNTAALMDEALVSLLEKKDFEYITIKEICERAGVNRSTFYLHYETKDDLLDETLEYINGQFLGHFETDAAATIREIRSGALEKLVFITPRYLIPYLSFVRSYRKLFKMVLARPKLFRSEDAFKRMCEHLFIPILERFGVPHGERGYMLAFYIEGIMGIVSEWLRNDCAGGEEMIAGLITKYILMGRQAQNRNIKEN